MENEDLIVLTDETGRSVTFEQLDVVEYDGDEYAVLYPAMAGDNELVHILLIMNEDIDRGEVEYAGIEDEELIQKVYEQYLKKNGIKRD